MFRYAYHLENGVVKDLRFVDDKYVLQPGEIDGHGVALPDPTTLGLLIPPPPVQPILQDVINALPPTVQAAIAAAVAARKP